jgi:hypothetical protein
VVDGPAVVRASFPYIGPAADHPGFDMEPDPIEAAIQVAVAGATGERVLSATEAVDVALGDPEFALWVTGPPRMEWINPHVIFLDGRWEIGLFKLDPVTFEHFGMVRIDGRTGQIVDRRFDGPKQ